MPFLGQPAGADQTGGEEAGVGVGVTPSGGGTLDKLSVVGKSSIRFAF